MSQNKTIQSLKIVIRLFVVDDDYLLLQESKKQKNKFNNVFNVEVKDNTDIKLLIKNFCQKMKFNTNRVVLIDLIDFKNNDVRFLFLDYKVLVDNKDKIKNNSLKWKKINDLKKKYFQDNVYQEIEKIKEGLLDDYKHKYQLALAEQQNYIKAFAKEKESFLKYANEQLLSELIPVYDNMKISMNFVDKEAEKNSWAEGIKYIIKQFKDVLSSMGVKEIKAEGKKFDPNLMEAIEGKGNKVKKVLKPGYLLHNKVIIPAKVILE